MDLEKTGSACGAKLLWKTKILSIEHTFDRPAPDVGPRKQFTDPDLENLRQIEHLDVRATANTPKEAFRQLHLGRKSRDTRKRLEVPLPESFVVSFPISSRCFLIRKSRLLRRFSRPWSARCNWLERSATLNSRTSS